MPFCLSKQNQHVFFLYAITYFDEIHYQIMISKSHYGERAIFAFAENTLF